MDGGRCGGGSAAAAGGDDDDIWRNVDAGRSGAGLCDISLLLMAVVGVGVDCVSRTACVIIEGGVAGSAVEVADTAGWPHVIWAARH